MQVSKPNENGVIPAGCVEKVATRDRAYAAVRIALCEDGAFRMSVDLMYSYGGFCSPTMASGQSYGSKQKARIAGLEELLRRWPEYWPSEPQSVRRELQEMREQVERQLRQPSLF